MCLRSCRSGIIRVQKENSSEGLKFPGSRVIANTKYQSILTVSHTLRIIFVSRFYQVLSELYCHRIARAFSNSLVTKAQCEACKQVEFLPFARCVFELLEFLAPTNSNVKSEIEVAPPHVTNFDDFLVLAVLRRQKPAGIGSAVVQSNQTAISARRSQFTAPPTRGNTGAVTATDTAIKNIEAGLRGLNVPTVRESGAIRGQEFNGMAP